MKEYFCNIAELSEAELEQWYHEMDPHRQEKCKRYQNSLAQRQCIAADHLARVALSNYLHCSPNKISFSYTLSGKPYLEGNPIFFSLSHSDTMVACIVSATPVGIDIEKMKPVSQAIRERICTPTELEYLHSASTEEECLYRFFYLWTRKEVLFKIDGHLPRRDKETEVLRLRNGVTIETREERGYMISVATKKL